MRRNYELLFKKLLSLCSFDILLEVTAKLWKQLLQYVVKNCTTIYKIVLLLIPIKCRSYPCICV